MVQRPRTLSSAFASRSLSFSSRSACSLSAKKRLSPSSCSMYTSFWRSLFSSSVLEAWAERSWRSRVAWVMCEVNACERCWRFAVECCGSGEALLVGVGVRGVDLPRSRSAMSESRFARADERGLAVRWALEDDGAPPFIVVRAKAGPTQPLPKAGVRYRLRCNFKSYSKLATHVQLVHTRRRPASPWTTATMKVATLPKSPTMTWTMPRVLSAGKPLAADTSSRTSCRCPGRPRIRHRRYTVCPIRTSDMALTRCTDQVHAGDIDLEPEYQRGTSCHCIVLLLLNGRTG